MTVLPSILKANAVALLTCALTGAAVAQGGALFTPIGDFEVYVDGRRDQAAGVYRSASPPAVIVASSRLPSAVLIHVRSRGVQALPTDRFREHGGNLELQRGEALTSLGSFEIEGAVVVIRHGDQELRLQPSPALVGERRLDELFEHSPEYRTAADAYEPDAELIAKLAKVDDEYRVRVVFGSWCSVCKIYLPRGLRVQEAVGPGKITFEYYGLPVEDAWEHPQVKLLEVKALPTAVVFRGDEVVGRYQGGEGWDRPELSLWQAVSASPR
ncbi:MAG: thioredoxin family protein [Acidobacteriota bacterium]|nr:thioredoxin family protein [Acidobacteriota bacterium]